MAAIQSAFASAFSDLTPAIMSGTFMSFLAALVVFKYVTELIDEVLKLVPLGKLKGSVPARVLHIIIAMFIALIVLGVLFSFIIRPVYNQSVDEANANAM